MAKKPKKPKLAKSEAEAVANAAVGAVVGGAIAGPLGAVAGAAVGALLEKGPSKRKARAKGGRDPKPGPRAPRRRKRPEESAGEREV